MRKVFLSLKSLKNIRFFNPAVLLALIILAQCALILYYAGSKKNFYMDEVATLLTANNSAMTQDGFLEIGRIYSGDELKSAITIGDGERFKFGFVKRNLLSDPLHVPLYFFSFNAAYSIYSFFSDAFSVYPGIILNLAFFILTGILLYKVSCFIFDSYSALLVNILWGFSTAAINSVLIIRPYSLLTCIFIFLVFCVFTSARKRNIGVLDCFLLWFAVFCGILTHYHFFIFASMVLFLFFVFLLHARRYKDLLKSALTVVISFLSACICYPVIRVIYSLITSNTVGSRQIFLFNDLLQNAYVSLSVWLLQTIGGVAGKIIFWAGIAFILFLCVKFLIDKKQLVKINFFTVVCFTGVLFIIITWQFLIYRNWHDTRYLWPAYPVAAVFLIFLLETAFNLIFSKSAKKKLFFAAAVIFLTAVPFFEKRDIIWLYADVPHIRNYKNALVLGINDSTDTYALLRFSGFIYDLSQMKNFVILGKDPGSELDIILKQKEIDREQIVILLHFLTSAAARDSVLSLLGKAGYSESQFLFSKTQTGVFLFVKNKTSE